MNMLPQIAMKHDNLFRTFRHLIQVICCSSSAFIILVLLHTK
uniref:Uncharacterized protein n=1 Tax=Arundo donax TaxID=35708 RepID=A0A0A9GZK1_ARUDO